MPHSALGPVFALVTLSFVVWLWMYAVRLHFIWKQRIDPQALNDRSATARIMAGANTPADNFSNLLEMPLLFYTLTALLLISGLWDPRFTQLAWGYVLLRALHSAIHLTYNRVVHRFAAYVAGCIVLAVMWIRFAWMYWATY